MKIQAKLDRRWIDTGDGPTCDARLYRLIGDDGLALGYYGSFCAAADQFNAVLAMRELIQSGGRRS